MSTDWSKEASEYMGAGASAEGRKGSSQNADRSSQVQARLKSIYRKTVLPVERRFRYDYFYESPFLTDVEFDCEYWLGKLWRNGEA